MAQNVYELLGREVEKAEANAAVAAENAEAYLRLSGIVAQLKAGALTLEQLEYDPATRLWAVNPPSSSAPA